MALRITGGEITKADGTVVARIEAIKVGGGTAGRMNPQGAIEWVTDPLTDHFHLRLLSQAGNMVPDELILVDTWDDAVRIGEEFLAKVEKHADLLAEFNGPQSAGLSDEALAKAKM